MMDYQVADMTSTSSAYSYYPNYHNHSHLHHHHHMHHNTSTEVLSNSSLPNHTSVAQLTQVSSSSASLYHEYGISMEPAYYEPDSAYYGSHTSLSEHLSSSPAHQSAYSSTPANTDLHSDSPTTHIISSDNGLSYTNLDYIYGQTHPNPLYLPQQDDKSAIPHSYNSATPAGNIELNNLHQTSQTALWSSHHSIQTTQSNHHEATAYLENSTAQNPQINHLQQMPCISHQTTLSSIQSDIASDLPNSRSFSRSEPRNNSTASAQAQKSTSQQPTYKWMQVKRNVPKPQGRSTLLVSLGDWYLDDMVFFSVFTTNLARKLMQPYRKELNGGCFGEKRVAV